MKKHCNCCGLTQDIDQFAIIKKPGGIEYRRNKCRTCTWGGSKYIKTFQRNGQSYSKEFNWLF